MLKTYEESSIPIKYRLDSSINRNVIKCVTLNGKTFKKQFVLKDVDILNNGAIISKKSICPQSSLYSKYSVRDYLLASKLYFNNKRNYLPQAYFFPRLINQNGTYGDCFAEFLIPFASHDISKSTPILFDADFIFNYAKNDLFRLGYTNLIRIPDTGYKVGKLIIKFPDHYFDNIPLKNIIDLKAVFPIDSISESPKKIYLSRYGYDSDSSLKNYRNISNELEVENLLRENNFFIVRAHDYSNSELRSLLHGARFIVFNHGSAFVHAAWSSVESVVEIASEEWWNPFFLKLCVGIGVKNYSLLMANNNFICLSKLRNEIDRMEFIVNKKMSCHII